MIKKIIFDLDNTLIPWEDEKNWQKVYLKLKEKYNITKQEMEKVKIILNTYEFRKEIFDMEVMLEMVNKELKKDFTVEFIKTILSVFEKCIPNKVDEDIEQTLKYLKGKYELVVLTNWFENQQKKRLENCGILKYFKAVYGADNFKPKPDKQAYRVAMGECLPEECIMIGDGIENDIKGAVSIGIDTILCDYSGRKREKYKTITEFKQLKNIL